VHYRVAQRPSVVNSSLGEITLPWRDCIHPGCLLFPVLHLSSVSLPWTERRRVSPQTESLQAVYPSD
jgi:hypothetical protein